MCVHFCPMCNSHRQIWDDTFPKAEFSLRRVFLVTKNTIKAESVVPDEPVHIITYRVAVKRA